MIPEPSELDYAFDLPAVYAAATKPGSALCVLGQAWVPALVRRALAAERATAKLRAVLEGYKRWEADLVVLNPWLGAGGLPTLTEADYDGLMELQRQRNAALGR